MGRIDAAVIEVEDIVPLPNVSPDDRQTSFRIDPADQFQVQRSLRAVSPGLRVIGHFHSHPGRPGLPSKHDCAAMTDPNAIWVIVGGSMDRVGCIRAFLPTVQGFDELDVLTAVPDKKTSVTR